MDSDVEMNAASDEEVMDDEDYYAWSFGGLVKTFATRSESVLGGYRCDLEDLGSGLRLETAAPPPRAPPRRYLAPWRPGHPPPPTGWSPSVRPSTTSVLPQLASSRMPTMPSGPPKPTVMMVTVPSAPPTPLLPVPPGAPPCRPRSIPCDLVVVANGRKEKIASGLLNPFVAHLKVAQEQIAKEGYSITLEPDPEIDAPWFTRGTVERFVRFVSTPKVLERVTTIESEILQIEDAIAVQGNDSLGLRYVEDYNGKLVDFMEGEMLTCTTFFRHDS